MRDRAFAKQGSTGGAFAAGFLSAALIAAAGGWLYLENRPSSPGADSSRTVAQSGASETGEAASPTLTIEDLVERAANEAATPTPSTDDSEAEALRTRLARAERDARRYKEGLERAVAKLNQTTAELDVARRIAERARASTRRRQPRPASRPADVTAGVSRTDITGDQAVAVGWVENHEKQAVRGTLRIDLFETGTSRLVDRASQPMTLTPGERGHWEFPFTIPLGISVTVESAWEPD